MHPQIVLGQPRRHLERVSVLNVVVSRDVETDRLDETDLADFFSFTLSVPEISHAPGTG